MLDCYSVQLSTDLTCPKPESVSELVLSTHSYPVISPGDKTNAQYRDVGKDLEVGQPKTILLERLKV